LQQAFHILGHHDFRLQSLRQGDEGEKQIIELLELLPFGELLFLVPILFPVAGY
jgi:hypothetical protein